MRLISDSELKRIPIRDNKEKLVLANSFSAGIIFKPAMYLKNAGPNVCRLSKLIRQNVAQRLKSAKSYLPRGYKLCLRCGYRSLALQRKIYRQFLSNLKTKHPHWSSDKLCHETSKFIAPPDIIPPHSTGGAIDLTIINKTGRCLNMGTRLGSLNIKSYTSYKSIGRAAKNNRRLLIRIMSKAGFVNYPTEWWHWSYGDRYWAAVREKKYSIYKGL